jgi:formate hydrogenlyase subunit 6/NADH:ubiquinone oxidoreductase subunit I
MFSIIRTIWYVLLHMFHKRVTVQYRNRSHTCPLGTAAASFFRAIRMAVNAA